MIASTLRSIPLALTLSGSSFAADTSREMTKPEMTGELIFASNNQSHENLNEILRRLNNSGLIRSHDAKQLTELINASGIDPEQLQIAFKQIELHCSERIQKLEADQKNVLAHKNIYAASGYTLGLIAGGLIITSIAFGRKAKLAEYDNEAPAKINIGAVTGCLLGGVAFLGCAVSSFISTYASSLSAETISAEIQELQQRQTLISKTTDSL